MTDSSKINKAKAYLKPILKDLDEDGYILSEDDSMVETEFNEDLVVFYLYEDKDLFKYVQNRDIKALGITTEKLSSVGIENLYILIEEKELRLQEFEQGYYALFLDGNFEASLILLDDLWNHTLNSYVTSGYAVAIPSRDVICFCDINASEGIKELKQVIERVWEDGDHLLTKKILTRIAGKWSYL